MRHLTSLFVVLASIAPAAPVHVWEKQELTFTSSRAFTNPYTDVTVWVDLTGPGFHQRIYGFWDGDRTFRVRLVHPAPRARNRRGGDGTPFFVLGDTWYAAGANRFKWYDDDIARPLGPGAGFKDYVRYRQAQGYNWVNIIAAFPNWMTDGSPWSVRMNDAEHTTVRSAWLEFGTGSAKNMDNEGGRPFFFPGKVPGYENMFPDVDRINPAYFHYIDRKIDYLNAHGFVPFIEVSRRDASLCWMKYYQWPDSYARFIQYVWSRYQANNTVLSPIHLDIISESVSPNDFLKAIKVVMDKYGPPPFGTLLSANANPSTLENWGDPSWVTLQQTGNMREHNNYWYLTEIFQKPEPKPGLDGEPYYSGYNDARSQGGGRGYQYGAPGGTDQDARYVRSAMYGNFLSGGLAGHVYGAEGIWGADIEPTAPIKMWDAFQWSSAAQMQYLRTFAFSIGRRYQDLVPDANLVSPHENANLRSYEGWAYCARTPDKNIFLAYFEKDAPRGQIRGAKLNSLYKAEWFDPRTGTYRPSGDGTLRSSVIGIIQLPEFPSDTDWGLRLTCLGPAPHPNASTASKIKRPSRRATD